MLRRHGLAPRKRLGQNFLRDRSVLDRILRAGHIDNDDQVLEVGAGTGVLTEALAGVARRIVAVELDDALFPLLGERFSGTPRVELLHANALEVDPSELFEGEYKLLGNIPYYITGPLVRHFLEARHPPNLLVFMVQKEVAERMAAAPGRLSLLGVSVQFYARVTVVSSVPAGAFYPRPKVDSAIVRIEPHHRRIDSTLRDVFFTLARAGFSQKRKQLANALAHGTGMSRDQVSARLQSAGIEPYRRAESLAVDEWIDLARRWEDAAEVSS
jgi:16S rRNA (adenine1518-N6/adenine1519-N6)-dimethyltransferase